MMDAVVFDLFGTLIGSWAPHDIGGLDVELGEVFDVDSSIARGAFIASQGRRDANTDGSTLAYVNGLAHYVGIEHLAMPRALQAVDVLDRWAAWRLTRVRPGAAEACAWLRARGLAVGVLSDTGLEVARALRTSWLVDSVDAIVTSAELKSVKPDVANFNAIVQKLGVRAEGCLFCGDGGSDEMRGALAVGMTPVLTGQYFLDDTVRWRENTGATLRAETFDDIISFALEFTPSEGTRDKS